MGRFRMFSKFFTHDSSISHRYFQIESAYERIEREYEGLLRDKEQYDSIEKNARAQMEIHLKRLDYLIFSVAFGKFQSFE